MMTTSKSPSFTLIELLIVLALIAILAAILIITIRPGIFFSKARDTQRINDLRNIEKIIDTIYVSEYGLFNELNYASPNIVYISLPDSSATCTSWLTQLPSLPSGWSYRCSANPQNIDGTGWIPIPFNQFSIINIAKLPVDPINEPPYYYSFVVGGSYALYAMLEDPKNQASKNDNDNFPHLFSAGNNKNLINQSQGLVLYLPFDEGSGTIAKDFSGNNNHGTLVNNPQWVDGKVGKALSFDGIDDNVIVPHSTTLNVTSTITIIVWIKPKTPFKDFFSKSSWNVMRIILNEGSINNVKVVYRIGGVDVTTLSANNVIVEDEWRHIAWRYNGNQTQIFIDGNSSGLPVNASGSLLTNSSEIWFRWGSGTDQRWYKGLIDEVRIYNRALSDDEIKALYEATK